MLTFLAAALLILLSPGPTNTLMSLAGAQGGPRRAAALVPFEVAGYLVTIVPLLALGEALARQGPAVTVALRLVMAGWVLFPASRLWTAAPGASALGAVTGRRIFATTLLNPKSLVFALVLLPAPEPAEIARRLIALAALVAAVGLGWGWGGSALAAGDRDGRRRRAIQRLASLWLAAIALALLGQAARA